MAVEGLSVREVGGRLAGVGGRVVPAAFTQLFLCSLFECAGLCINVRPESRVGKDRSGIPVLNGMTLPSLLAQKASRWYSAYSGVLRNSLFSFLVSMAGSGSESTGQLCRIDSEDLTGE